MSDRKLFAEDDVAGPPPLPADEDEDDAAPEPLLLTLEDEDPAAGWNSAA